MRTLATIYLAGIIGIFALLPDGQHWPNRAGAAIGWSLMFLLAIIPNGQDQTAPEQARGATPLI